jgi:RimJ/RimL family protein N-acetyltransferase
MMAHSSSSTIRLEPLSRDHLDGLALLIEDPLVRRNTRVPEPTPPGFAETWLELYESGRREGTRQGFAIVENAEGAFLGIAGAVRIEPPARTAELGYAVVRSARGRGVASEALRQLTAWGFADLGALRLELLIAADNEPSKTVARRCGYTYEGLLRSLHFKDDRREDTEIWSRLPSDPRP